MIVPVFGKSFRKMNSALPDCGLERLIARNRAVSLQERSKDAGIRRYNTLNHCFLDSKYSNCAGTVMSHNYFERGSEERDSAVSGF